MIEGFQKAVSVMGSNKSSVIEASDGRYKMDMCAMHIKDPHKTVGDESYSEFLEKVIYLSNYVILKSGNTVIDIISTGNFNHIVDTYPQELQDHVSYLLKTYCSVVCDLESREYDYIVRNCKNYGCVDKIAEFEDIM